jgi:FYVE zinc finger/PX domain
MGQILEVSVLNRDGNLIGSTPVIDLLSIGENDQDRWHQLYNVNQISGEIKLGLMFIKDQQLTPDSPTGHNDSKEPTIDNLDARLEQMKIQVKTKEFWQPEKGVKSCPSCGESFSVFRRKHHCRTCGLIFDTKCLTEIKGQELGVTEGLIVCKTCLDIIENLHNTQPKSESLIEASASKQLKSASELAIPVHARIPRYFFVEDEYSFVVEATFKDGRRWELSRYYEDFHDFHKALLTAFPVEAGNTETQRKTLPYMPSPVDCINDTISEERMHNLDAYVKNLLSQPTHISRSTIVRQFFAPREGDYEIHPNQVNEEASRNNSMFRNTYYKSSDTYTSGGAMLD